MRKGSPILRWSRKCKSVMIETGREVAGLCRHRLVRAVCLAAFLVCAFGTVQAATTAYELTVDGEPVLCVKNVVAAEDVIDEYLCERSTVYGESVDFREQVVCEKRFVAPGEEVAAVAEVVPALAESTTLVAEAAVFMIDGEATVAVSDEESARQVLRRIVEAGTASVEGADIAAQGFTAAVEISRAEMPVAEIIGEEAALAALSAGEQPLVGWQVEFNYRERVPLKPTEQVVDSELLPRGARTVYSEGRAGEQENLVRAVAVNGMVVSREVIASTVITEAEAAVVYRGTRESTAAAAGSRGGTVDDIPIAGTVTAVFDEAGAHWQHRHTGLDLAAPAGTPVRAIAGGTVVSAGWQGSYGNMVTIEHSDGLQTRYAHLSEIKVAVGDSLARGDVLGLCGATGNTTGPHLHFEVLVNDEFVDPVAYF